MSVQALALGGNNLDRPLKILWIVARFGGFRLIQEPLRFLWIIPFGRWLAWHSRDLTTQAARLSFDENEDQLWVFRR